MTEHRLSALARADLDEIWLFVATESGSVAPADRLIDAITERFYLLAEHPKIGRNRDDDLGPGTRSFPVGNYLIVYEIKGESVRILRVVHGQRDIDALFG